MTGLYLVTKQTRDLSDIRFGEL